MRKSISKKQLREFGFLIGLGFPIVIGWIIPAISGHFFRYWTLFIGLPSIILSIFKPKLLFYLYKFWMALGFGLGFINSRIILGIIFLLVLVPISFIMKLFGYDPLRENNKNQETFRENKEGHKVDLTRIF